MPSEEQDLTSNQDSLCPDPFAGKIRQFSPLVLLKRIRFALVEYLFILILASKDVDELGVGTDGKVVLLTAHLSNLYGFVCARIVYICCF